MPIAKDIDKKEEEREGGREGGRGGGLFIQGSDYIFIETAYWGWLGNSQ